MTLYAFGDMRPRLASDVFVAPGARIIGDVEIGEASSVWFQAVVRGDVHSIRLGARTNVQDHVMVHVTSGRYGTIIEDDVTIGHGAIIHGCYIAHHALIGMGAIVMDGARVGPYSLIAAGSVVTPGTVIPEGVLAVGSPARPRRALREDELRHAEASATSYANLAARYRSEGIA